MDEFDAFMNAGGGEDQGIAGDIFDAGVSAVDQIGGWLFGEDEDVIDMTMTPTGDYGTAVASFGDPSAQNAAMQIVSAIMSSGAVGAIARNMLDRLPGVIFDAREPAYNGSPLTTAMLSILFRKCTKNEQEAIIERLAGGMTPMSDNNKTRSVFRVLYVYDALRALNEKDAAEAIFFGQK